MNFEAEKFDIEKPEEKEKIRFPNIEKKFPNGFPKGWRPQIDGWAPKHEELKEKLPCIPIIISDLISALI